MAGKILGTTVYYDADCNFFVVVLLAGKLQKKQALQLKKLQKQLKALTSLWY